MFVRYDCGCIGIPLPEPQTVGLVEDATAIIIEPCDEDRDSVPGALYWAGRNMQAQAHRPLGAGLHDRLADQRLHARIAKRLRAADRFYEIQTALRFDT